MGKGTDKLYITHSEWASSDAFSASKGAGFGHAGSSSSTGTPGASFRRLPFNFCAASLQPFVDPVCTAADGTIFDADVIQTWLTKHKTNPVTGAPLKAADLVRLHFARNDADGSGDLIDPVTFKVFTDNTHIVALRHGDYANVFAYDTIERMNIKPKMWRDLVDDVEFTRKDMITLQDPHNMAGRDMSQFKFLQDGGGGTSLSTAQKKERAANGSNVNVAALGRIGEKVLGGKNKGEKGALADSKAGKAVAQSAPKKAAAASALASSKPAYNAATYTTGRAAASFTSTGLTPETSGERAVLSEEEWLLRPRRIKIKGFARIETSLGDLNVELHTDTAPKAVWNFVRLAQSGYYRDVVFHRNIRNFMVQGGDPSGTGRGGQSIWGKNFADEMEGPLTHSGRGVVSMANKGKNTNGSQFFITYRAAKHLDRKHTIFGQVMLQEDRPSQTTLDQMEATPVSDDGSNRPLEDIVINDIVVYLDPFEEFLKEKKQKDDAEVAAEQIRQQGGTDDDKLTWTGKRIRGTDKDSDGKGDSGVGKYLKEALKKQKESAAADNSSAADAWEEPVRKKAKSGGGFGNFDAW